MNICVFGLWHLGSVTAACVAEHFPTIGLDPNPGTINDLNSGRPPIFEPGLEELVRAGLASGRLQVTTDLEQAAAEASLVWVAFDTPVDEEDRADTGYVEGQIRCLFPYLRNGTIVLISSQLPVGSTRRLEKSYRDAYPQTDVRFAYSPENLRLGKALDVFRQPERIVVGIRNGEDRARIEPLLATFCEHLVWMSVESAEMTKHALNAFLANSVAFINEIASLCEETGADAKEVESGLKTDVRIGPRAYLGAGGPFAGGTLARDVSFLTAKAEDAGLPAVLLRSIRESNDLHKAWPRRKLESILGELAGKSVCILGLTYKPGTNTLRRSAAIELCRWLSEREARVAAFDPAVSELPRELSGTVSLRDSAVAALKECDAAVVSTEWPEFRDLSARDFVDNMNNPVVLDANRFLERRLAGTPGLQYIAVGMPKESA
jgi:UDPglucose 6-dehydrogenase